MTKKNEANYGPKFKLRKFLILAILLVAACPLGPIKQAQAGVNLKNGNYYISYTDLVVPGVGGQLEVTRTYNSNSDRVGFFGYGWGSDYETRLVVAPDGSVVIHENGSGAQTRFISGQGADARAAAHQIVEAMKKQGNGAQSGRAASNLIEKLSKNAELRREMAARYGVKAKVKKGTVLFSKDRGLQQLFVKKKSYKRKYHDGRYEIFDKKGRMVEIRDKHSYKVKISYNKAGKLTSIKDSRGKQIYFEWYKNGLVKNTYAGSGGGKKAKYKYEGKDLVESTDVAGNTYKYKYDSNHNLVQIAYSDKTTMEMAYDKKTNFLIQIKDQKNSVTQYEYKSNPKNPELHYWTTIKKKGYTGKEISNRYEYELKLREDGSQYTYRTLTEVNGLKTETIYHESNGLPTKITRGKRETTFAYNKDGLLVNKKSNNGVFVELSYDPKWKKINRVKNNQGWTTFAYDRKGNLKKAVNSKGNSILLHYNRHGQITSMKDTNTKTKKSRRLSFEYDANGKPIKISLNKVGKILVKYNDNGEIQKVDSKAGPKMALQVTSAFQNLLDIVRPAGVNLNL